MRTRLRDGIATAVSGPITRRRFMEKRGAGLKGLPARPIPTRTHSLTCASRTATPRPTAPRRLTSPGLCATLFRE